MHSRIPIVPGFSGYDAVRVDGKVTIRDTRMKEFDSENSAIENIKSSYLGDNPFYSKDIVKNWEPYMRMAPADGKTGDPLTTKQISAKKIDMRGQGKNWNPTFYVNPMQDLDYMIIEGVTKTTFTGAAVNALTRFTVGTGFRPELELLEPTGDAAEDAAKIQDNQHIIKYLKAIDRYVNRRIKKRLNLTLIDQFTSLIDATNTFNRSALMHAFDVRSPFKYEGTTYKDVPTTLIYAHPRDLGLIETDPETMGLESVQWRFNYELIPVDKMIYLWNPLVSAKYHNAMFYGGSMVLPMMDAARTMRSIVGTDFPAMARSTWAGMPIIVVKPQGQDESQKLDEYTELTQRFVRGAPNFMLEDPDNVKINTIDFQPKVAEFMKLVDFLARYNVASLGLPQTMFFDETTSTRSTMLGKIQLALSTVINPLREQFGRQIVPQWWGKWFEMRYEGQKEFDEFEIKMVWNDLHIEKWFDKVESVNMVDSRQKLKNSAFGELAGIDDYENKVDENAEIIPGGDPSQMEPTETPDGPAEVRKKDAK